MELENMIKASRGEIPADLLLANARIVNVYSGEIIDGNIAVSGGRIVGIGNYQAEKTEDLGGKFVCPGFFDAHVHIESSMVGPPAFARAVVPFGTTSAIADPHEIANVLGTDGIRYMIDSSTGQPADLYFMLPSCVPATDMETAGAKLDAEDLAEFISHERILGLAEMMNFPGVLFQDPGVMAKIKMAKSAGKIVDGHAPGLSGSDLNAYVAAGISSDHECMTPEEAEEKLGAGMHIMIREGTGAKNLGDLLPVVNSKNWGRFMWCTDDRHPHDIIERGHIDSIIRDAIKLGLDPITAIRIGTLNPARYFGVRNSGAIAPGKKANLVVFSDLEKLDILQVWRNGVRVAANGELSPEIGGFDPVAVSASMNVDPAAVDFTVRKKSGRIRVIEIVPGQIFTRQQMVDPPVRDNNVVSDVSRDLLKIAVVDRYTGKSGTGIGFVTGMGLGHGALASSVAHDSHNIIVVGASDADMKHALKAVSDMGGGLVAVSGGKTAAALELPIAGLMSHESVATVKTRMDGLLNASREMGSAIEDPFMLLSFLALPVIPELKLTDKGLVDVNTFQPVSLFG